MRKRRDPRPNRARLTPETVGKIAGLIHDWPVNRVLTWDGVVVQAKDYLRYEWTRQGLERHDRIKQAFEAKREAFREWRRTGKGVKRRSPEIEAGVQRATRLARELEEARRTLNHYDDLFARHHCNALAHGMTLAQLEAPLEKVDRLGSDSVPRSAPRRSR